MTSRYIWNQWLDPSRKNKLYWEKTSQPAPGYYSVIALRDFCINGKQFLKDEIISLTPFEYRQALKRKNIKLYDDKKENQNNSINKNQSEV